MHRIFVLLLAVLCACEARAEIVWKQKAVVLRADAGSTVLEARFPFSNVGPSPVDILQVESSCGCTTANLEKRHYESHESGEVVARYTVGTQSGTQTKTVLVATNDGHAPTTLTLEIHLPETVRIMPPSVQWKHGELPIPKTIVVEILANTPAKSVSVTSSAAGFDVQSAALTPGRSYELAVRPSSTAQAQFSTLSIRCRFGNQEKVCSAYASVRALETKD